MNEPVPLYGSNKGNKAGTQTREVASVSFRVAVILHKATNFSRIRHGLDEIGVESIEEDCRSEEELIETARSTDFIVTIAPHYPYTRKVLKALERCKFIETLGVGYDGIDMEAANEYGIGVVNNNDYHVEDLPEYTMALILACCKRIVQLDNIMKSRGATPEGQIELRTIWKCMSRLNGKTLGLIGLGRIARAVAVRAKAFGMKIAAYDPYVSEEAAEELEVEMLNLEEMLAASDYISIHANLTAETRHLINAERLKLVKENAYIINTARGAIVDESALSTALKEKRLAGAALDTTDPEPMEPDNPLLKLDNVILTGHSAHSSPEGFLHRMIRPSEEVARVMRGEWPIGLVNPEIREKYIAKWGEMRDPVS